MEHVVDAATWRLLARLREWGERNLRTMETMAPDAARAMMRAILARFGLRPSRLCRWCDVAKPVAMRFYRPPDVAEGAPCVVFFHGGGWAMGDVDSYHPLVDRLAARARAPFVSVDYRLAPEHPFPAALEDCLGATRWALAHAAALGGAPGRVMVMGDSAGGGLAAAVARLLSRERPGALAGQILLYPLLDIASPHARYPSRLAFGDGRFFLACGDIDAAAAWYAPEAAMRADPRVSPLWERELAGLPPTRILTPGCDPLRDEGAAYARKLRAAGVPVRHHRAPKTIHAFLSFRALPVASRWRGRIARWLHGGANRSGEAGIAGPSRDSMAEPGPDRCRGRA